MGWGSRQERERMEGLGRRGRVSMSLRERGLSAGRSRMTVWLSCGKWHLLICLLLFLLSNSYLAAIRQSCPCYSYKSFLPFFCFAQAGPTERIALFRSISALLNGVMRCTSGCTYGCIYV